MMLLRSLLFTLALSVLMLVSQGAQAAPLAVPRLTGFGMPRSVTVPGALPPALALPAPVLGRHDSSERSFNPKFQGWTIEELEDKKDDISLGGPIALIAVGAPVSVLAGYYAIVLTTLYGFTKSSYAGSPYACSVCDGLLVGSVALWGATGVGIGLGLWGSFTLGPRIKARRELTREIELREKAERRGRRDDYGVLTVTHGPMALPLGGGWGFHGTF